MILLGSFLIFLFFPQLASASLDSLPPGVLERETCGSYSVDIFGYGAGMMQGPGSVQTANAQVSFISSTENCAVVQWESDAPAASQVLFSELSSEPVTIVVSEENFGYPHATVQNNAGNSLHTAILTGLEPGKAYTYRLVTRSHPTAMPTISDPQVFIAGPSVASLASMTPSISGTPTPTRSVPAPAFDSEKFPLAPAVTSPAAKFIDQEAPPTEEETRRDIDTTSTVPAAVTAAEEALDSSRERDLWTGLQAFFAKLIPDRDRLRLSSSIGLFEKDRYIIPTLFFLGLLFLLQHLVLPALGMTLRNSTLYWLFGTIVLAIISAVFMFYYITLVAIGLFLGLLAWYLLKSIPEDEGSSSTQPKLLKAAGKRKKVKGEEVK
tara:strand:- start:47453 stop:48592 length:1140 start_codon:yes stop_codon:yes gene_type:complete